MNPTLRATFVVLAVAGAILASAAVGEPSFAAEKGPAAAPALAEKGGNSLVADVLSAPATSLLQRLNLKGIWQDNETSHWVALLAAVVAALVIGRLAGMVLRRIGRRLDDRGYHARGQVVGDLIGPCQLVLLTLGFTFGLAGLTMGDAAQAFAAKTLLLLYTIAVLWFVYNLVDIIDLFSRRYLLRSESFLDENLAPLMRKSMRVVLVVVGLLYIVESVFDRDIGAWLAGLGIAGLAISLAAQDSLRNLFGSLTVLLDRPFRIGERILCSGHDGVVEEIGFRSTKLRTAAGHLVTIPNLTIVNSPIENIDRRGAIRRAFNLVLAPGTPSAMIERALTIIREILTDAELRRPIEPVIRGESCPPRVYLADLTVDGPSISVTYWHAPPDFWAYMEHAERVNLRIREAFERAGITLAFKSNPPA